MTLGEVVLLLIGGGVAGLFVSAMLVGYIRRG